MKSMMVGYTAYILSPGGAVWRREDFYCSCEDEALSHARQWTNVSDVEVWSEDKRKLKLLKCGVLVANNCLPPRR
jgi:hypothetical protein